MLSGTEYRLQFDLSHTASHPAKHTGRAPPLAELSNTIMSTFVLVHLTVYNMYSSRAIPQGVGHYAPRSRQPHTHEPLLYFWHGIARACSRYFFRLRQLVRYNASSLSGHSTPFSLK